MPLLVCKLRNQETLAKQHLSVIHVQVHKKPTYQTHIYSHSDFHAYIAQFYP